MTPFGLYIHIPFCRSKCGYCSFYSIPSVPGDGIIESYLAALAVEIAASPYCGCPVDTIYFGGGTPSYPDLCFVDNVLSCIRKHFVCTADAEISIEINPEDVSAERLSAYFDMGFTRSSLGVQTLDPVLHGFIERTARIVDEPLLDMYFSTPLIHGIDVIAGIPGETEKSITKELSALCAYRPQHISMYMLTFEESTRLYDKHRVTDEDELSQRNVFSAAMDFLAAQGYSPYEISNFSLLGFCSRHNLKYWQYKPYIGFGAGAHSFDGTDRFYNLPDVAAYIQFPLAQKTVDVRSTDQKMAEFIFSGLRLTAGISEQDFFGIFHAMFPEKVSAAVEHAAASGLIHVTQKDGFRNAYIFKNNFFVHDSIVFSIIESLLGE